MVYILGDPERIYTGVEVREKKVAVSGYLVAEEDFVSFLIYKFNDVFLFFGSGYLQGYAAQLVVRRERECAECGVVCERVDILECSSLDAYLVLVAGLVRFFRLYLVFKHIGRISFKSESDIGNYASWSLGCKCDGVFAGLYQRSREFQLYASVFHSLSVNRQFHLQEIFPLLVLLVRFFQFILLSVVIVAEWVAVAVATGVAEVPQIVVGKSGFVRVSLFRIGELALVKRLDEFDVFSERYKLSGRICFHIVDSQEKGVSNRPLVVDPECKRVSFRIELADDAVIKNTFDPECVYLRVCGPEFYETLSF